MFAERPDLIDLAELHEGADNLPAKRYKEPAYRSHIAQARHHLGHRDPDDVAPGALALKLNVPVWSNDNDLRELPLTVYTTAMLLRVLGM